MFIEFFREGRGVIINTDHLVYVEPSQMGKSPTLLYLVSGEILVDESYDEVFKKVV